MLSRQAPRAVLKRPASRPGGHVHFCAMPCLQGPSLSPSARGCTLQSLKGAWLQPLRLTLTLPGGFPEPFHVSYVVGRVKESPLLCSPQRPDQHVQSLRKMQNRIRIWKHNSCGACQAVDADVGGRILQRPGHVMNLAAVYL